MGHDPVQYPHAGVTDKEKIHRDVEMINYFINHDKWDLIRLMDIIDCHRWIDDFCQSLDEDIKYDLTVVDEGQGTASYTCADLVNGVLMLSNDIADNDSIEVAGLCECWKLLSCYPLIAEIRFKISEVIQSDMWFGLITGATWFTQPDDAVVFYKLDGAADLYFRTRTGAVNTNTDTTVNLVNLTWYRLMFHWDGGGNVRWFVFTDGDAPQVCVAAGIHTTTIPTTEMALGFGIRNGEAVSKVMYVDYIKFAQTRVIEA